MTRRSAYRGRWGNRPALDDKGFLPGEADRQEAIDINRSIQKQMREMGLGPKPISLKLPLHNPTDPHAVYGLHTRAMAINPRGFRQMGAKRGITKPQRRNRLERVAKQIMGAA